MSEQVCKKHRANPVTIYSSCIGCELEQLTTERDALAQRCRELDDSHKSAQALLCDDLESATQALTALRATITAARDKLGPAVRNGHPALTELAAAEALALLEAACADTTGDTPEA